MNLCRVSVLALICLSVLFVPGVAEDPGEDDLISGIQKGPTVTVAPAGTAVYGSRESMTGYQEWLESNAILLMGYSDAILAVFGIDGFSWPPGSRRTVPAGTLSPTPPPTFAAPTRAPASTAGIRESPGMTTIATITGDSGFQERTVTIPCGYWELWYTADPVITGGQDSHSASGTNSAVFPVLKMVVSEAESGDEVETVEPPGGLDKNLWQRAGDPRPWSKKFYTGNKEFTFMIEAHHVRSYAMDIRVRTDDMTS